MAEKKMRARLSAAAKTRIALDALRSDKTVAQIASAHGCHASKVSKLKKEAIEGLPSLFSTKSVGTSDEKLTAGLYEQIGRLKVELEWLKKKHGGSC